MINFYSHLIRFVALPSVSMASQSNFWKLYQKYREGSWNTVCSPSTEKRLSKITSLIEHAYNNSPFYHDRMEALGLTPNSFTHPDDLWKLPPTTKADIITNFPDRITDTKRHFRPWRYVSTSGTVERMTVIHDFRKRDVQRAAQLVALNLSTGYQPGMRYLEIPPDVCVNICGVSNTTEPRIWRYVLDRLMEKKLPNGEVLSDLRGLAERQLMYRRLELTSFDDAGFAQKPDVLNTYIQRISDYRPYVMKALPIYLYLLAIHLLDTGMKPPTLKGGLLPMGYSVTPHMKRVIETAFDCPLHEDYGSAELGAVAAECGRQNGLHPFSGLFHIEVIRDGRPTEEGEVGRVLITDLYNYAMPLIRYDIGDVAVIRRDPCECGIGGERLEIQGRVQDCLIGKDGAVITPDRFTDYLLERPDVLGFQLTVQQGGDLHLQVVPRGACPVDTEAISQHVLTLLGEQSQLSVRIVPTILPESGGKYRLVKNHAQIAGGIF